MVILGIEPSNAAPGKRYFKRAVNLSVAAWSGPTETDVHARAHAPAVFLPWQASAPAIGGFSRQLELRAHCCRVMRTFSGCRSSRTANAARIVFRDARQIDQVCRSGRC